MNDAQAVPGESLLPASTDIFTATVFVLIALFAIAAVAIMVIGARRKRRRVAAEEVVQERIEQEEAAPAPPAAAAAPAEPAASPSPRSASQAQTPKAASGPLPSLADEPIAAVAAGEANLAAEAASAPAGDDPARGSITQLKGLGPKVAARLAELGIVTVGDLAALSDADAARLDAELGPFAGRMARDRWLEQARLLAAGDRAGFEGVFGRL